MLVGSADGLPVRNALPSENPATVAAAAVDELMRRFPADPIAQLSAIHETRRSLRFAERDAIRAARAADVDDPLSRAVHSWRSIGQALGIGPSAAWRRHRRATVR
jgi:hypothetical protein